MNTTNRRWHVVYYEDANGRCEVREFIAKRTRAEQAKAYALFAVLEERGPQLPRPYADLLKDGIHELRVKLKGDQVRVLYFFCYRDFIVLTHSFVKRTGKVPEAEIRKAKRLRADFLQRRDERSLREARDEDV